MIRSNQRCACLLSAVMTLGLSCSALAQEYTLIGLGDLPGGRFQSVPLDINDLGQIVGQGSSANGPEAFMWEESVGLRSLGDLAGGGSESAAYGINDRGQVVGYGESENGTEAFLWDRRSGMIGLGDLPGGDFLSRARAINNAGQVVGSGDSDLGRRAFLWDATSGMVDLGVIQDGPESASLAYHINNAGEVVGRSDHVESGLGLVQQAFVWAPGTGMVAVEALPGGAFEITGRRVNDAGHLVGNSDSANGDEAYIWDSVNGIVGIGDLPGGLFQSRAFGVNDRGQVVGTANTDLGDEPFIWDEINGMVQLSDLIVDGSDAGWNLEQTRQINNRGQIVGFGINPEGQMEAFLLTPVVPSLP